MILESERDLLVVGYKQTMKALAQGNVKKVYIAQDCDDRMINDIEKAITGEVLKYYVPTRKELGEMCHVKIGTSCAVILK